MTMLPLIILALTQGITEFLPISSSGHLILVHQLFGDLKSWENRLVLDVAVHIGTLLSVLVYFRKDIYKMLLGIKNILRGDTTSQDARLNFYIIAASIPVIIAGLILHLTQPSWLLLLNIVALTTLIFGVLLWVADRRSAASKTLEELTFKDALLIGLAQMLALIPGTSRSGITMTAARFLGYSRTESAHFSLLLAIIAIAGAGTIAGLELYQSGDMVLGLDALIAATISFIAGWLSISLMMKWLERASFKPFAIYRIILGIALLIIINAGTF
ncbi:MAG: undecaprenyl-diphosphate phosphatase [Rhodospirillales bacterium]|nr:undecaprenyl-diphosphate phosphatase [Rhodospirillales bacterium]